MATTRKDLGPVTAYAIAVANGFTGTEAEWTAMIANASTAAQDAAQSAGDAAQSAQETADLVEDAKSRYGSPLKAETAAEMTDTAHIYVYTGSETGYTAGNWYYHNGSAWVSGGVYNATAVSTDKTLTVEDMAADSKVVGGKVTDLKSDLLLLGTGKIENSATITSGYFQSGYWTSASLFAAEARRLGLNPALHVASGTVFQYDLTGNWNVSFKLFANTPGTAQTAIDETDWLSGSGSYETTASGYVVMNLKNANAEIAPSDFNGTITYTAVENAPFMLGINSKLNPVYSDFYSSVYPNKDAQYIKGLPSANGTISTSANGATSSIIKLLNTLYISDGASAVILLYQNNSYVGKVNTADGVDQIGGNWKYFTGLVDVAKLLNENQCNGVVIGLVPNDGTTIADDTTATAYASAHLEYSVASCLIQYVGKQDSDSHRLDVPQVFAFSLCAHRGSSAVKDNTIASFERAVSLGYRVVETDINWTSDNVCILYHDNVISGTPINTLTYAQVHALDADIPTFAEMLLWAKKHKCLMFLDCVGRVTRTSIGTLYNLTAQYGMLDNVVFSVGSGIAYNMVTDGLVKTNVSVNFYGQSPTVEMINAIDSSVDQFKNVMTGYNKTEITSEIILASHLKGYPVEIATITTKAEAQSFYNMGVDMLVCNADELWDI